MNFDILQKVKGLGRGGYEYMLWKLENGEDKVCYRHIKKENENFEKNSEKINCDNLFWRIEEENKSKSGLLIKINDTEERIKEILRRWEIIGEGNPFTSKKWTARGYHEKLKSFKFECQMEEKENNNKNIKCFSIAEGSDNQQSSRHNK
ncbi:hypothetical protein MSUIS_05750 [Mycoplasma suis KI3806]|uniref:Uncharacterized protein n=1 Tax=Mycoplasma suis (strain KI_3806) TaxID=708248 RepID=F0V1Y7_MYCS3|nr:hypothetical protein [Mycoplasma suis]CBZ40668.1 hypothetical protein MSUIS_05750 [Mycoplasma suis KI3806]